MYLDILSGFLAAGITGSFRGINFDDYRPDLIIVDDPQTDETAATLEQRNKVADLILGAVKNCLAPSDGGTERQTRDGDNAHSILRILSQQALQDQQWTSKVFPCWTKETLDLPVAQQLSSWEEQFPTVTLQNDKLAALQRNKLSIFSWEMECRLISAEISQFKPQWLNVREHQNSAPQGCFAVLGIDPVPPPSERQMARGLQGKDWEAHYVWGRHNGEYHLLDYARNRGHEPSWSVATALALAA